MANLTDQDREWIKLVAREIAFAAVKDIQESHIDSCPHGKRIDKFKWMLLGILLGVGATAGGAIFGVIQFASKFIV